MRLLLHSIRTRLLPLSSGAPSDSEKLPVVVIPGHGPTTTLQDEKRMNPFLQQTVSRL